MKRRRRRLQRIFIALIVMAVILGYRALFNGNLVYFTMGLDKQTLLEVEGNRTGLYEAQILFSDIRSQYEELFGDDVWSQTINGQSFEEYARSQVKTKLIRVACMNRLAQERGVVLGRDENTNVTKAAKEYMEGLSQEQRDSLQITQESAEVMYRSFAVANRLFEDMTKNLKLEISADQARVIRIQYISAASQDEINKAKRRLDSGESFFYVARDINEGGDYEYELKRSMMDEQFENAAYNLATGETSDIVSAGGRYYIIKCISDNEKTKTETNRTDIMEQLKLEEFNKIFEEYEASTYVHFNDRQWERMSFSAVRADVRFEDIFNKYFRN